MSELFPRDAPWSSTGYPALQLLKLDPAAIDALAAGDLRAAAALARVELGLFFVGTDCLGTWRRRSRQLVSNPADASWITRVVYDPARQLAVGRAGFHGAPDKSGAVEVGYAVDPHYRRQGYARAALDALVDRAAAEPSVQVVRATISPDNVASRCLVAQLGFVEVGEQYDPDDGAQTIFELGV